MALFEKGNPGGPGRPRMPPELRKKWSDLSELTLEKLETLARDDKCPPNVLAKIAEISTDLVWGKPIQSIDAEVTERRPIVVDSAYGEKDEPSNP
jgi:hypothetical protein